MAFNETELAQVKRSGEHFKKILRNTFAQLPRAAHSVPGLARLTGVNKSTCQRLVQALTKSKDGIDVVLTLPGQTGLQQLREAFSGIIDDQDCLTKFDALTVQYHDLILQYAASQSEFKRLLLKCQSQGAETFRAYQQKLKKNAFQINKEMTEESVDLYLNIHICRVNPNDDSYIDELMICHRHGVELSKSARPFVQAIAGKVEDTTFDKPINLNHDDIGKQDTDSCKLYLLRHESTADIERCYAGLGTHKDSVIYNHILSPIACGKFDITFAFMGARSQPNPMTDEHNIICHGLVSRSPAKRLLIISLLAKSLDKGSKLQSGCYPASSMAHRVNHHPEDLWNERFTDSSEIKLFDPSLNSLNRQLGLTHIDRLINQGFAFLGEDPADFIGYFNDVEYPTWLTSHRIYFEFE